MSVVARSSAESEYRAMAQGVCEFILDKAWNGRIKHKIQGSYATFFVITNRQSA